MENKQQDTDMYVQSTSVSIARKNCPICKKRLETVWSLKKHLETHQIREKIGCNMCDKKYIQKADLAAHLLTHNDCSNPDLTCNVCRHKFSTKYKLKKHQNKGCKPPKLSCPICGNKDSKCNLILHFKSFHGIEVITEHYNFPSLSEFEIWKNKTETDTKCKYCISYQNNHTTYYYCSRSGYYKPEGTGKRRIKALESNKINGFCPAKITTKTSENGKVNVIYIKTHVGHGCDLKRLSLDRSERLKIASMISDKIPFDVILDEVRSSVNDKLKNITRKDLFNIEKDFNLKKDSVRHSYDTLSVHSWIKEISEAGDTIVRFYKPQNVLSEEYPSLLKNDFVLILMSDVLRETLQKLGNNLICISGTHSIKAYNFELTTILVIDDLQQAVPCAFLVSNRMDFTILELFLNIIFTDIKIIPKILVSDMNNDYYNAWMKVMPPVENWLYCCWDVDREWRKNLFKIKNQEKRTEIYKGLRMILEERDQQSFALMLQVFISTLDSDVETKDFGIYFKNYSENEIYKKWAYCFRPYIGLNTNINLERMHKTSKCNFMKGKRNKQLDKGIKFIVKLIRDNNSEKLNDINKRKITTMRSIHKKSEGMAKEDEDWLDSVSDGNDIHPASSADQESPARKNYKELEMVGHSEEFVISEDPPNDSEQVLQDFRKTRNPVSLEFTKKEIISEFSSVINSIKSEKSMQDVLQHFKTFKNQIEILQSESLVTFTATPSEERVVSPHNELFLMERMRKKEGDPR